MVDTAGHALAASPLLETKLYVPTWRWRSGHRTVPEQGLVACHTVTGVEVAVGTIGPSLDGLASRAHLAAGLPVTRENVAKWISDPGSVKPGTVIPNLGLSEDEVNKLAVWLMTLK